MLMKAVTVGGGGGGSVSIAPDTSNLLHSITSIGASWTTTEDCIMCCVITGGSYFAQIWIGTENINNVILTTNSTARIGIDGNGNTTNYGFFIPKGTTIGTRSDGSGHTYNIKFYKPL